MKKIAVVLIALVLTIACKKGLENAYVVEGSSKKLDNGTKLFIQIIDSATNQFTSIDTAVVENGKFKFDGKTSGIEFAYLKVDQGGSMPFILENGKIDITFDADSTFKSTVKGTFNNDMFQKYNDEANVISIERMQFIKKNDATFKAAQKTKDTIVINKLIKEDQKFQERLTKMSQKFSETNNKAFVSLLLVESFFNFQQLPVEDCKKLFESLDDSLKSSKKGKKLQEVFTKLTTIKEGNVAPDFSAPSPDGKTISLKESLGKVTIIDFWASWCGPCRAENPNVVALYNEFHDKGLNIIGVSLDKDAAKWKEAIAKDGLVWNHVSNLKHWKEPIALQYNVTSIPATFILDEKGVIVARDLRGEELKAKVQTLLAINDVEALVDDVAAQVDAAPAKK